MAELPPEIITDILSRVPVKPLIRFKCVSKPWYSLISSPNFINRHLQQTLISNPNPQNIIISHKSLFTTGNNHRNNLRFTELNHPLKHLNDVVLIDSCHGIALISDKIKHNMVLYNPTTNSHRLLPPRSAPPLDVLLLEELFGFGYDSLNDDYKVVRLIQWATVSDGRSREASVYSLRDDVWKSVKYESYDTMPYFLPPTNPPQHAVAAKEMLHFIATSRDLTPVLKCFDLRTETILIVDYPELNFKLDKHDFCKTTMSLRELHGCLCLLVNYRDYRGLPPRDQLHNLQISYADVWEMRDRGKKESWVKLFRIQSHDISKFLFYLRLVTYSEDKRKMLVEVDGRWFGWYDLVSKRIERVVIQGWEAEDMTFVAMPFVESLVSVSNDKAVSEGGTLARKKTKRFGCLSSGFKLKLIKLE